MVQVHNHCYEAVDLDAMVRVCVHVPYRSEELFNYTDSAHQ